MNAREMRQASLEKQIEKATDALRDQLTEYKEKGGGLLVIAGIALAAYLLYKLLSSSDDEEVQVKQVKSENSGYIKNAVLGLLGSVALAITRDKLTEIVENYLGKDDSKG